MKAYSLTIPFLLGFIVLGTGCVLSPNEKAGAQLEETSRLVQSVKTETASYAAALTVYRRAKEAIDRLLLEYSSTPVAAGLKSGQTRVAGLTLAEFKALEARLAYLAAAERDPLALAALIAQNITDKHKKDLGLARIAIAQTDLEHYAAALAAAESMSESDDKAKVLLKIADNLSKAGNFDEAFRITQRITSNTPELLVVIAKQYAKIGKVNEAVATVDAITASNIKGSVLFEIADILSKAGYVNEALLIIKGIAANEPKLLGKIAEWYAQAGKLNEAIATSEAIANESEKDDAFRAITEHYSNSGQFTQAAAIANYIKAADWKIFALQDIAYKSAVDGHLEYAHDVLRTIATVKVETEYKAEKESSIDWVKAAIAERYAENGQFPEALKIIKSIKAEKYYPWSLGNIAVSYAEAGQFDLALTTLKTVKNDNCDCDTSCIVPPLTEVISSLEAGNKENADRILAKAIEVAKYSNAIHKMSKDGRRREPWASGAFAVIAAKYAEFGQFQQALKLANAIKDKSDQSLAFDAISAKYAKAGRYAPALELIRTEKARFFIDRARYYAQAGQNDMADALATAAEELAKRNLPIGECGSHFRFPSIVDPVIDKLFDRLSNLSNEYAKVGRKELAVQLITQAETILDMLEKNLSEQKFNFYQDLNLKGIYILKARLADQYAKLGETEAAARLTAQFFTSKHLERPKVILNFDNEDNDDFWEANPKSGLLNQTLTNIQTIDDNFIKIIGLTEFAVLSVKTGYRLDAYDLAILAGMLQAVAPLKTFWLQGLPKPESHVG